MPKGFGRPGTVRRKPKKVAYEAPSRFKYKPSTPRADLSEYNAARKVGYKPKYRLSKLENMQAALRRQRDAVAQINQSNQQIASGTFTGHREAQRPITTAGGRRVRYVDPALMKRVMSSPPSDNSGAFEQQNLYQGEDFVNYLYEQGIVPHFGNVQSHSGKWVDYLLSRMGVTGYGVNPFARPRQPQGPQQAAGGGGGGGGGRGGGGGGGYTPPKPKQYGGTRNVTQYNPKQWLLDMVVWNI